MDFAHERELVRLRHELRRLVVERRTDEARDVLARLEALAIQDAEEASTIRPEVARWLTSLERALEPS
jgi:hypothetical protein